MTTSEKGGLVRNPEARILYRNIEVLADGTAVVTSQTNLPNDLPRSATSFSYTANLQCSYRGSISPTVGTCAFTGRPVRPVVDVQGAVPDTAQAMIDGQCNLNSNAGTYCDYKLKGGATLFVRGMGIVKYAPAAANATADEAIHAIQADRLYVRSIQYNSGPEAFIGTLFSLTNTVVGFKRGVLEVNAARQEGSFMGVLNFELSM
ncbi:hypothetical protein OEZ86_002237 [Tetradesmus obliquus]|nr:hypothetical protein OEZ86_002237 [Tetradesmus obliquus]